MGALEVHGVTTLLVRMEAGIAGRAVSGAQTIVPFRDGVAVHVFGGNALERLGETQTKPIGTNGIANRNVERLADVTDALEAAVAHGGRLPPAQAADVEL